jgi:hypothetical protein
MSCKYLAPLPLRRGVGGESQGWKVRSSGQTLSFNCHLCFARHSIVIQLFYHRVTPPKWDLPSVSSLRSDRRCTPQLYTFVFYLFSFVLSVSRLSLGVIVLSMNKLTPIIGLPRAKSKGGWGVESLGVKGLMVQRYKGSMV